MAALLGLVDQPDDRAVPRRQIGGGVGAGHRRHGERRREQRPGKQAQAPEAARHGRIGGGGDGRLLGRASRGAPTLPMLATAVTGTPARAAPQGRVGSTVVAWSRPLAIAAVNASKSRSATSA